MTHKYSIHGMTCNNCVAHVKSELLKLGDVTEADVQLHAPQATITMQRHIPLTQLQSALNNAGNYTITEADGGMHHSAEEKNITTHSWFQTYKPILLICVYLVVITLSVSLVNNN